MTYFRRLNHESTVYIVSNGNRFKPDVKTKWHKLKERDGRIYRAVCGYEYDFLLESPTTAEHVFNLRVCNKCEPQENVLPDEPPF